MKRLSGRRTGLRWTRRAAALACALALAVGCGGGPPLLKGSIKAEPSVNPDRGGRPSPIVVRVYELKGIAAFNNADFFSLFDKEQEALSGELVGREEYQMQPGETRQYSRQLQPDTKFIGVVGAFRDLDQSRWRQTAPVPTTKKSATIAIGIQSRAVTLAVK
jgi:type VI secretion system protein VasD